MTDGTFLSFNGGLTERNVNVYIVYMITISITKKEVKKG